MMAAARMMAAAVAPTRVMVASAVTARERAGRDDDEKQSQNTRCDLQFETHFPKCFAGQCSTA